VTIILHLVVSVHQLPSLAVLPVLLLLLLRLLYPVILILLSKLKCVF
jgi:hypothetical protein